MLSPAEAVFKCINRIDLIRSLRRDRLQRRAPCLDRLPLPLQRPRPVIGAGDAAAMRQMAEEVFDYERVGPAFASGCDRSADVGQRPLVGRLMPLPQPLDVRPIAGGNFWGMR